MNNKCKCGKYISEFAPSTNYCSKTCEDKYKDSGVDYLMNMFGIK